MTEKRRWVKRARERFETLFCEAYECRPAISNRTSIKIRIYHHGYYAYGERISAEEEKVGVVGFDGAEFWGLYE